MIILAAQQIPLFQNEYLTFILLLISGISAFWLPYANSSQKQKIEDLEEKLSKSKNNKGELKTSQTKLNKIETICESTLDKSGFITSEFSSDYYLRTITNIYQIINNNEEADNTSKNSQQQTRKIIRRNTNNG